MNKLSKPAKVISVLLNLTFWAFLLYGLFYGGFALRSLLMLWNKPDSGSATTLSGITLDYVNVYSSTGIALERSELIGMQLIVLPAYFLELPLVCYGIQLLRKVLALVVQQRPFSGASHILKKLGWISLLTAFVQNASNWAMIWHMENKMPLSQLFLGGSITRVTYEYQFVPTYLLVAIVVFILSGVFRYGEELQQLSDETL